MATASFPATITAKQYRAVARLSTTLSADITSSETPIPVASVTSFPAKGYITIDNETIYYDGNTTTLGSTSATRGFAGTAVAHLSGAAVKYSIVAETINQLQVEVEAMQGYGGGWTPTSETWTYASASTFTIATNRTSTYSVGMKLRLTQTTVKYFYISAISYSSPNTTVTINGAGLYTVADATITSPYYSSQETPFNIPQAMIPGYVKCSVLLSASQANLVNNTFTKITLNDELFDIGSNFASNKFTAPVTGYYQIAGQVVFAVTNVAADKEFLGAIYKNNASISYFIYYTSAATQGPKPGTSILVYLAKDDYIELFARHLNGTDTISVLGGTTGAFMSIVLVSIL